MNAGVPGRLQCMSSCLKMKIGRVVKKRSIHCNTYAGSEISVDEAKKIVLKYADKTGSVDLEFDAEKCIAKICLNNPRLKNAINGRVK